MKYNMHFPSVSKNVNFHRTIPFCQQTSHRPTLQPVPRGTTVSALSCICHPFLVSPGPLDVYSRCCSTLGHFCASPHYSDKSLLLPPLCTYVKHQASSYFLWGKLIPMEDREWEETCRQVPSLFPTELLKLRFLMFLIWIPLEWLRHCISGKWWPTWKSIRFQLLPILVSLSSSFILYALALYLSSNIFALKPHLRPCFQGKQADTIWTTLTQHQSKLLLVTWGRCGLQEKMGSARWRRNGNDSGAHL